MKQTSMSNLEKEEQVNGKIDINIDKKVIAGGIPDFINQEWKFYFYYVRIQ